MQAAIDQFRDNIRRIHDLQSLYASLVSQSNLHQDLSDVLRSALVMGVSALDQLVHEVVRLGMVECWAGRRFSTESFLSYSVSVASVRAFSTSVTSNDWLDNEISIRHRWRSFQTPDNIANAIRLISDKSLWQEVGKSLGIPTEDVRKRLTFIIQRRNKIVHEADLDPSYLNTRWPITEEMAFDAIDFVESVGEAIFSVIEGVPLGGP